MSGPLARRWAEDRRLGLDALWGIEAHRMNERLFAWVREYCEETQDPDHGIDTDDREAIAHDLMMALGEPFTKDPHGEHGATWELIDAAKGWP